MDLLIVGNIDGDKFVENIPSLGRRLGREINYSIKGVEEFRKKRKQANGLINGVLKKSTLVLLGNPDGLCEKFNRERYKATWTVFQ